ncbi:TetR/AcrR family transcriptional regulator [Amycolatopsis pithecellobii]|uniref:TetR/AcrR family transcriptional regulator n=1 Tax=Amycolatopsis pithecellobii TaxID=664692 RepID=UPI001FE364C9|nr:TetR/AcrR family transcriptional regulator [Amycolatopsis pithecellobii]
MKREEVPAKERILVAAEELFAESGFDATPTSRIAEHANVPKGLVHYYFRRKADLLGALIKRLPDEQIDPALVVVPGDIAESLRRLVSELDARLARSRMLSHLLWREADTHRAIRRALDDRFQRLVRQVRAVILTAGEGGVAVDDVDSAAGLLALALSYRHSVARHKDDPAGLMEPELNFIAGALMPRPAT